MTHTEHTTKGQSTATGTLGRLRALLRMQGIGAPAGRRPALAAAGLALVAAGLLSLSPAASADSRIGEYGLGAGQLNNPAGLAVSQKEGEDIYVADSGNRRIDQFDPSKPPSEQFVRAFGWKVNSATPEEKLQTCTAATGCRQGSEGSGVGQVAFSDGIAVDNDSASASYGDVYVVDQRNFRVEKYGPAGEFLLMFGGEVDQGPHHPGDLCTAAYIAEGDTCGKGVPGTGPAHFYRSGPLSWEEERSNSIAVGPGGTVYVGDYGRIQEFEPDGSFAGELELPDAEPQFVTALAVAPATAPDAGDIYERSAIYQGALAHQVPGIRRYSPAHALLETLDSSGEPTHLALDSSGDLFAADFGGGEILLRAFKPNGALYAELTSGQLQASFGQAKNNYANPNGIAAGTADIYAPSNLPETHVAAVLKPEPGPPLVELGSEHVTSVEPTTATLHAAVNPEGYDTSYHFEYGLEAGIYTGSTPSQDLGLIIRENQAQGGLSGLAPGTTYHYRATAESECNGPPPAPVCITRGPDQTFTTLPPVSVRGFTTQTVGPELVTIKVQLNPNGSATNYTIRYGKNTSYAGGASEGSLPIGNEFLAREVTFTGLKPNTEYHYQLIAHNGYPGEFVSSDQTFTTEESSTEERAAESCPNTSLREEDSALSLPDCRDYEQVSPPSKAGFPILFGTEGEGLAPDGERAAFNSVGSFAGNETGQFSYVSHRTATGWITRAANGRPAGPSVQPRTIEEYSAGFDRSLARFVFATTGEQAESVSSPDLFFLGNTETGSFLQASPVLAPFTGPAEADPRWQEVVAASADLSHLFLRTGDPILESDPVPREGERNRIYEVSGPGGPNPVLSLAAEVSPSLAGNPECRIDSEFGWYANSSSADGSTLFYDAPLVEEPGAGCESESTRTGEKPNKVALFARVDGAPPIELSAKSPSQCSSGHPCYTAPPANAHFYATSPDASRAWFTTEQPLIDSDTDTTNDLYLAKLEGGQVKELVQASAGDPTDPTPGHGAGVQGVIAISQDATHFSFVATGVLTTKSNPTTGLSAVQGADNLYVYDSASATTKFVARLCSGPEESGSTAEPACPAVLEKSAGQAKPRNDSPIWAFGTQPGREAQLTPDGHDLLFTSYGRLTPDKTSNATAVFRYDFQTGQLVRVSIGRRGNDANGNDDAYDARISGGGLNYKLSEAAEDGSRAISADGSTVVFSTAAPLVSHDTNGVTDAYEWEEQGHGSCREAGGCISLISSGTDPHPARVPVIGGPSGRDITFNTPASLVPGDRDGVRDVYDARTGGGFHATTEPPICTSPETCLGPVPPPPPPPNISTPNFVGPGNQPEKLHCGKGRHRVKKHGEFRCVPNKRHKKHHHKAKHKRAARANRGGNK